MQWQREQVLALAPDQASVKAAQSLINRRKWPTLGSNAIALWGECQGSGKSPYQTAIDLREPAFKCSCPSRKFPCKHGLALFLLAIQSDGSQLVAPFDGGTAMPDWVAHWLEKRAKQELPRAAKAVVTGPETTTDRLPAAPPRATTNRDPQGTTRRAAARAAKVAVGIEELTVWLKDLVRAGFIEAQTRPDREWQQMSARLVDAQAPGLAAQVQSLRTTILSGEGWAERFTAVIGRLFLLLEAYRRIDQVPVALQHEIRSLIGWHQSREDVLAGPAIQGRWRVLSQTLAQEEELLSQRIWLQQATQERYALILNFAHPTNRQALDVHWRVGTEVDATLYFYDGALPLRALATNIAVAAPMATVPTGCAIADALHNYQQALAINPWVTRYPLTVIQATVGLAPAAARAYLYDEECHILPLSRRSRTHWQLLSITGGRPASIFGEWQEDGFVPLALWHAGRYWAL
ncbi:MAG: SWIM zinc finger family protein [Caldilineaceae bacterium]|nr:SWIM zinc finger family protein [Caldilineaceae bacterium]